MDIGGEKGEKNKYPYRPARDKETSPTGTITRTKEEQANTNPLYTEIYHNKNTLYIPATETIAKVEAAVRQLDAEQADTVRRAVNGILQQAEPPEPNITKEMRDAFKSLKKNESIMVLAADKGLS